MTYPKRPFWLSGPSYIKNMEAIYVYTGPILKNDLYYTDSLMSSQVVNCAICHRTMRKPRNFLGKVFKCPECRRSAPTGVSHDAYEEQYDQLYLDGGYDDDVTYTEDGVFVAPQELPLVRPGFGQGIASREKPSKRMPVILLKSKAPSTKL